MLSSRQSFQFSNKTAIEEALALSQQKSLIIQKYMQKLTYQQNRIQQLVLQIQRLNWQNRQQQYRDQYTKKHCLQDLIKDRFAEQVQLSQGKITNTSQQGGSQQQSNKQKLRVKRYILRIIVNSDVQQIQLTQKMQLLKGYQSEPILHQNRSTDEISFIQIQSYCQQVISQVQQMKLKLWEQQQKSQTKLSQINQQLIISRMQNENLKNNLPAINDSDQLKRKDQQLTRITEQYSKQITEMKGQLQKQKCKYEGQIDLDNIKYQLNNKKIEEQLQRLSKDLSQLRITHQSQITDLKNQHSHQIGLLSSKHQQQTDQSIDAHQQYPSNLKTLNIQQPEVPKSNKQIHSCRQSIAQQQLSRKNEQLQKKILLLQRNKQLSKQNYENQLIIRTHNFQQELTNRQDTLTDASAQVNSQNTQTAQLNRQIIQLNTRVGELSAQVDQLQQKLGRELGNCQQKDEIIKNFQLKQVQINERHIQSQRQLLINPRPVYQTVDKQCQTDPQYCFGSSLRNAREEHNFSKVHNMRNRLQESKIISLPPPSLEMFAFDFDNSMSSEAINSNLQRTIRQMCSNLSSSSFGMNEKNIEQTLPNVSKMGVIQETKYCSLQNIKISSMTQKASVSQQNQLSTLKDMPNFIPQMKTRSKTMSKPKIMSCSQKNIIRQDSNQDQQNHQIGSKSKRRFKEQIYYQIGQSIADKQDQLIPSRSSMTSSRSSIIPPRSSLTSSVSGIDRHLDNPINDQDQVQNSDNPSQTYKNSLKQMTHKSNTDSNQSKAHMYGSKQQIRFKKDSNCKDYKLANRATQLLQLKSPERAMKSLIDKSFPIQKNPFKLSYEYLNVAQILKSDDDKPHLHNSHIQKKSQNGSDSFLNILIETQNNKLPTDKFKHQNILDNEDQIKNHSGIVEQKNSQKRKDIDSNKAKGSNKSAFQSSAKKVDYIQLTDSIDLGSIKKVDESNKEGNSSSKKKHKIIYLRR